MKKEKRYAMVIDLQQCTGCGACIIACKNENNLPDGVAWASRTIKTVGKFPNVRFEYIPTLCNHCKRAPCVQGCPTQAMHKTFGGITMHNPGKCIGCRYCMTRCPYGVIYFNWQDPFPAWRKGNALLKGCTTSPTAETEKVGGRVIPYYNAARADNYPGIRPRGVVEKCTFCDHRLKKGKLPYCVLACPADARVFGDLNDPGSKINHLIGKYRPFRLREGLGTEPRVFYIRSFNPGAYVKSKGGV